MLDAGGVHHRPQIVDALVKIGKLDEPIRHSGTTLVEHQHLGIAPHAKEPTGKVRFVPVVLDARYEGRCDDDVDRTFTKRLIGNVNVATFGVARDRWHGRPLDSPELHTRI